ncbi:TetR/AcrR family transcriptional regulator [Nocardia anaemiae]|uniref:TetR/AcrR family transcriptional regulator n=1 Tax=Nocardia anaemiae TaxID=263910 RepID=UPI0007A4997C|nr:TetR/AcrR family transcriptional regulator [Nocardia anaemiae]
MNEVKGGRRRIYAALTRAAVLEAASTLFVRDGFEATSVEDIARLSQSSKGAVYHHFHDKREMFAEVFRNTQAEVMRHAVEEMGEGPDFWSRVEAGTRAFLHGYVADSTARALLRQVRSVLDGDRIRAIDEETALPLIRGMFAGAMRSGDIGDSVPVEAASNLLFELYCNAVLYVASSQSAERAAEETEQIVLAMLRGLRATWPGAHATP